MLIDSRKAAAGCCLQSERPLDGFDALVELLQSRTGPQGGDADSFKDPLAVGDSTGSAAVSTMAACNQPLCARILTHSLYMEQPRVQAVVDARIAFLTKRLRQHLSVLVTKALKHMGWPVIRNTASKLDLSDVKRTLRGCGTKLTTSRLALSHYVTTGELEPVSGAIFQAGGLGCTCSCHASA